MIEVVVTSLRPGGTRRSVPTRKADYARLIFSSCAGVSGRLVLTISLCLTRRSTERIKHISDVLRGFRNAGSHRGGLIALTVEIAAGRLVTQDGLPSRAEVAVMTHGSGKLARGQFELTRAQEGHALWLDWPALEMEEIGPLESAYRHVPIELESDWRR